MRKLLHAVIKGRLGLIFDFGASEKVSGDWLYQSRILNMAMQFSLGLAMGYMLMGIIRDIDISLVFVCVLIFIYQAALGGYDWIIKAELLAKKSFEIEMSVAGDIQKKLIPEKLPESSEIAFSGFNKPAKNVGGDYYDVIPISSSKYIAILFDVAGKGVPASILMASVRSYIRVLSAENYSLTNILRQVNKRVIEETEPNDYLTLFASVIDVAKGAIEFVSAGHPPVFLIKSDSSIVDLNSNFIPLGLFDDIEIESDNLEFSRGDKLVIYSDGIVDAGDPAKDDWNIDKLRNFLTDQKSLSAQSLTNSIVTKVDKLNGPYEQTDDVTILIAHKI